MKNIMKYKGYWAEIKYSDEDECFWGEIDGLKNDRGFSPIDTVVPKEIGTFRIPQLITIFPLQHVGLTDIRVVFRLQAALTGKIVSVLFRTDVPFLTGNALTKTQSTLPDFIKSQNA